MEAKLLDEEMYNYKAQVIKAMAHPSRLKMIDALSSGELCVCKLQEIVGSDMSTVSKHLLVLRNAGIVTSRKEGLQVYYKLRVPCILGFLNCIDEVLHEDAKCRMAVCKPVASR